MKKKPQILHEDDDIIIVNKPPFFLTIPDRYAPEKENLYAWLNAKYGKVYIVHRLDKETSGVLVFAKNEEAHRNLSRQFEARTVSKTYLTLVDGVVHIDEGTVDKPIRLHQNGFRMVVAKDGKRSVTTYKVIERFKNFTLLEAGIQTGRLHQIRIHLESIGYPLAIDSVYGRREGFLLSEIKGRKYRRGKGEHSEDERPLMSRVILHSHRLVIDHPTSKERLTFEAELPKDFAAVMKQLRKWGR